MRDNLNNSNSITLNSKTKELETKQYKAKNPIIVGFDPGLTVGLAILDLNGNLLFLDSFKEISKSEIITKIMELGRAILIATDVENPPKAVKKLASSLNAKIFSPKSDISVSYKNEIVTDFLKNSAGFSIDSNSNANNNIGGNNNKNSNTNKNSNNYKSTDFANDSNRYSHSKYNPNSNHGSVDAHERDSLAAGIIAYNNYKNKLTQLERKFLEAKMDLNSIDKEDIINENYYEILNQAKSFLINDNPISDSITMAFEIYNLIDTEHDDMVGAHGEKIEDINDTNNINNKLNIEERGDDLEDTLYKLKNINKSQEKQIKNQDNLIKKLKNKNKSLSQDSSEKDEKIAKIEKDLNELKLKESKAILKDKEVASKIKLLKTIQLKYKEEKELRKSLEEKLNKRLKLDDFNELSIVTPIKIINSFTKNGLKEANHLFKLKRGDVIYLSSSEGGGSQTAKFITDLGIKAIILSKNNKNIPPQAEEVFENKEIPILNEDDLDIKFFDDYAVADSKILDGKISKWKEQSKEKIAEKAQDNLLNVINEYRLERKRDL